MGRKSDRLEEIRLEKGLTKAAFAHLMGIEPRYYSHISTDNGKGNLRIEHLEALLRNADVNPVWILTGEGEKYFKVPKDVFNPDEPKEEEVEALYSKVVKEEGADFDQGKTYLTKFICSQVIYEFRDADSITQLSFAARAYLRVVKRMPTTDFMEILGVRDLFGEGEEKPLPPKGE